MTCHTLTVLNPSKIKVCHVLTHSSQNDGKQIYFIFYFNMDFSEQESLGSPESNGVSRNDDVFYKNIGQNLIRLTGYA